MAARLGLLGRSMLNVIAKGPELGYIRCPIELFRASSSPCNLPDRETLLLMNWQPGRRSWLPLSRISRCEHPQVQVQASDTIIFSDSPISGQTISVSHN